MSESPQRVQAKYPIPWIATYFLTALAVIALAFTAVWFVERRDTPFDYSDPDMHFLERIALSGDPRTGDFSRLNGGGWTALCLVGWQGDVAAAAKAAKLEETTLRALAAAHAGVSVEVEETEFVLVYADGAGRFKAVRHPHGYAFAHAAAALCITREEPVATLPVISQ